MALIFNVWKENLLMIYKSINSSHSNYNNDIKEKPLRIYYEDKYQVLVTDSETDKENKG